MFQTICYESLKICSGLWPTYKTETPVTPARMGLGGHTGGLEQASLGWAAEQQKSENTRLLAGLLHLWSIRRTATARLSIIRSSLISLGHFKIPGVFCLSGTNTGVNRNSRFLSSPSSSGSCSPLSRYWWMCWPLGVVVGVQFISSPPILLLFIPNPPHLNF